MLAPIIAAIFAIVIASIFNVQLNKITQRSKDSQAFSAIFNITASMFVLLGTFFIYHGIPQFILPHNKLLLVVPIINAIIYGVTERLRFPIAKHIPPSTIQILATLQYPIALPLAYFLYHDTTVTLINLLGIILIFIANIILNIDVAITQRSQQKRKSIQKKYLILAGIAIVLYAIAGALDKLGSQALGVALYSLWIWIGGLPIILLFPAISLERIKKELNRVGWHNFIIFPLLNVIFYALFLWALQHGESVKIIILFSLTNVLTFFAESIMLKEAIKNKKKQAFLAILSTLGAIFVIN